MEIISKYFSKVGNTLCRRIEQAIASISKHGSVSTGVISQEISSQNSIAFKSGSMAIYRLLKDGDFQIDDSFWRCHTNIIFDYLIEKHDVKQEDNIQINIDYTTINDDFLILAASVNISQEKDIMLYFTMRNYPKRKKQMDQKKMELAFFKGLRHVLSKKFNYTIVADRGFGNLRVIEICENLGFNFVIRINEDLKIKIKDEKEFKLKELQGKTTRFKATVLRWGKDVNFHIRTQNKNTWYIVASTDKAEVGEIYESRFKIEKLFQDLKSSGYNIERTKIRKYDRVKRLVYLASLSHALMVFLGSFIKYCKKNYTNHWELATAYLDSAAPFSQDVADENI